MLHSLVVLVQLRVQLDQILDIDDRVLEVADRATVRFRALARWAIGTVKKDRLCWREFLELLEGEVLPLQVHQLLEQLNLALLEDSSPRLTIKIVCSSDRLAEYHRLIEQTKSLLSQFSLAKAYALLFDACVACDKHAFRLNIFLLDQMHILRARKEFHRVI